MKAGDNIELTKEELQTKLIDAEKAFGMFLDALGYDWGNDPNMEGTPRRVAKMFLTEIGHGAYTKPPRITTFESENKYKGMVFEGNVTVKSFCSHHFMSFFGKAQIAYIPAPDGKIIGLSKLNRIVEYCSRRPQVQENLTSQIHDYINNVMPDNGGVAVVIGATHTCVSLRGVNDNSVMRTSVLSGAFETNIDTRKEFYDFIKIYDN